MNRASLAIAVAIAASAIAGCSTTVPGHARPSTQLKAATAPDIEPATPSSALAGPRWIDVSGQGIEQPRDAVDGAQFGAIPLPGVKILHHTADGGSDLCTLGPAVTAGDKNGYITAGHCGLTDPQQYLQRDAVGDDVALFSDAEDIARGMTATGVADSAALWAPIDRSATRLAGTWPVAGVLTTAAAMSIAAGTPVCVAGAKSGVVCGAVVDANDRGLLRFAAFTDGGDSGSAVFLVDDQGRAALVGILKGGNAATTTATYLEPVLNRIGARALLDPSAEPFDGAAFSASTTTQ